MYTVPTDVYTTYPELSRPLTRVSKDLSRTLRGACNSAISEMEIIKYFDSFDRGRFGVFRLNISLTQCYIDIIHNDSMLNFLSQGQEMAFYGSITDSPDFYLVFPNEQLFSKQDVIDTIKYKMDNVVLVDLGTAYNIFNQRQSCLIYENYVRNMIKEYFEWISTNLPPSILGIYLILNAVILNLPVDHDTYSLFTEATDRESYVENIEASVAVIIGQLKNYFQIT